MLVIVSLGEKNSSLIENALERKKKRSISYSR